MHGMFRQFGMFEDGSPPPLCSGERSSARVQVCLCGGCPCRERALCQRPGEVFFQFPRGKISGNGKSFGKPDESNALMHGFVPFLVLLDAPKFVFCYKSEKSPKRTNTHF